VDLPEEVIRAVEFEMPPLEAEQALVEVVAAPINPADLLTLTGEYGRLPPLPAIGGREGVGRVAELGSGTRGPAVGKLVLLPLGAGSWATHVVVEAARLVQLPEEADPQQLSMMTINPPTAALLLSEFVTLGPEDWVIQNTANSAVGLYLVQLAGYRGHRTVNVVRREDAAAMVRETGGDVVLIDGENLAERVAEATVRYRRGRRERNRTPGRLPVRGRDAGQRRAHERGAVRDRAGRSDDRGGSPTLKDGRCAPGQIDPGLPAS
jgi:trans-2-enoyl-CoA reductase